METILSFVWRQGNAIVYPEESSGEMGAELLVHGDFASNAVLRVLVVTALYGRGSAFCAVLAQHQTQQEFCTGHVEL